MAEGEIPTDDAQIQETIWERVKQCSLDELPERLGFQPQIQHAGGNRRVFVDSGIEVTLYLGSTGKVGMIGVKRV